MTLAEQVFRKMGWGVATIKDSLGNKWEELEFPNSEVTLLPDELPPIDSQWEVCAQYLVPFMSPRGWAWNIDWNGDNKKCFMWSAEVPDIDPTQHDFIIIEAEIINDNLAEAACKAFLEVEI